MKYVDEWQPKIRLYRHKAAYNSTGDLAVEVGTYIDNVPGEPRYLLRKARIGLFAFPPSETSTCKWGNEEQKGAAKAQVAEAAPEPAATGTGRGKRRMGPHFNRQV